jgi:O-succinylbenzoic acid--CoA ligase
MLTVKNVDAAVMAARQRQDLAPGEVWLACLPLFHIGGLSILLRCLRAGACVVLHERFEPARVWEDLQKWRVTRLSLVPTMLALLLDYSRENAPPRALRTVLVGGSALSAKLAQRAYRAGWPICPTYGLSETASQVATGSSIDGRWYPGDVGAPLKGVRVDIVDDNGRVTHSEGRIRIAGATLMAGYANPEATLGHGLVDNAFISGDIGHIDKIGHLHVIGRADDRLTSAGETIHPKEIEDQMLNCPGIEDVAVSARPDETWGEYLIAVVAGPIEESNLRAWCESHLPSFQRPREFLKLDKLPRTSLGKLQRHKLKEWIAQL